MFCRLGIWKIEFREFFGLYKMLIGNWITKITHSTVPDPDPEIREGGRSSRPLDEGGGGGKRTHSARGAKKVWIFSCFGPRSDIDCWNNQGMVLIWNWVWFLDNVKYYALLFSCTHGIRLWHLYKKFGRSWAIMLMHPSKIRHRIFGHARNKEGKTLNSG